MFYIILSIKIKLIIPNNTLINKGTFRLSELILRTDKREADPRVLTLLTRSSVIMVLLNKWFKQKTL